MTDIFLDVAGCDDSTYIKITEDEAKALQPLIDRVNAASTATCQPKIYIERPGSADYDDAKESWEYQEEQRND